MKNILKRLSVVVIALFLVLSMVACGKGEAKNINDNNQKNNQVVDDNKDDNSGDDTDSDNDADAKITDDQALNAIKKYCFEKSPDLEGMVNSGEYEIYWNVESSSETEIVVLYRSYTGAQVRYYINPTSGDTYETEFMPGISSEEERTEETFNVRDYIE